MSSQIITNQKIHHHPCWSSWVQFCLTYKPKRKGRGGKRPHELVGSPPGPGRALSRGWRAFTTMPIFGLKSASYWRHKAATAAIYIWHKELRKTISCIVFAIVWVCSCNMLKNNIIQFKSLDNANFGSWNRDPWCKSITN